MKRKNTERAIATPVIPQEIRNLFGKRPLAFGEKPELYDALLSRFAVAVDPKDIIEWLYVKDVVDLTWEILRIRWVQVVMINDECESYLARLLDPAPKDVTFFSTILGPSDEAQQRAHAYLKGDSKAKADVIPLLTKKGLENDSLVAEAFGRRLSTLEITGRMLAAAEARRDSVFREIDRHRESLGRRMREIMETESQKVPRLPHSIDRNGGKPKIEIQQPPPKKKNAA